MASQASREAKARYRERNRERLRAQAREYAERKRRAAGIPAVGTPESTENRRRARKLSGAEHQNWKGDAVGYFALHAWIDRNKERTGTCAECGATPEPKRRTVATEWANISGAYHRDLGDYIELCCSCHRKRDMTEERRQKVIAAVRARPPVSAETRAKLSAATKRRWAESRGA